MRLVKTHELHAPSSIAAADRCTASSRVMQGSIAHYSMKLYARTVVGRFLHANRNAILPRRWVASAMRSSSYVMYHTRPSLLSPSSTEASSASASPQESTRQLTCSQRAFLAAGASVLGLLNPHRGDLIATVGETSGELPLRLLRNRLAQSEDGQRLLRERPLISSQTVDFAALESLPENTFGNQYARWMAHRGYSPDERTEVRFVNDPELAYVMQRYRQVHDLWHVLLGLPTTVLGELAQKVIAV